MCSDLSPLFNKLGPMIEVLCLGFGLRFCFHFRGHVPLFVCSDLSLLTNQQRHKTLLFLGVLGKTRPKGEGLRGVYGKKYTI